MQYDISALSFTGAADNDGGVDRWAPAPVLNWDTSCCNGRRFASEAVAYMAVTGDLNLIPAILRRIVERGRIEGTEIGFFTALAELATANADERSQ